MTPGRDAAGGLEPARALHKIPSPTLRLLLLPRPIQAHKRYHIAPGHQGQSDLMGYRKAGIMSCTHRRMEVITWSWHRLPKAKMAQKQRNVDTAGVCMESG